MSGLTKDSSFSSATSTSQEGLESGASSSSSRTLRVTLLSSEWRSTKGGLSTINRELAIQLAQHPNVVVSVYLPQCTEEDKRVAAGHNVHLIEAEELPGLEPELWLSSLPEGHAVDCVIGHGVHLGKQVQLIKRHCDCKWIQVVHTDPEELGMYKSYEDAISKGEKKHQVEVKLCQLADQVVAIGPKLAEAFSAYLRFCGKDQEVLNFTPSIFSEFTDVTQATEERKTFRVLVFGRGDSEDFHLKGYDIAAQAIAELKNMPFKLVFVGAPSGEEEKVTERLLKEGIARNQLAVRCFNESRKHLAELFCEVDLAIMPSRTEGFGLAALEALSAGLPVLVSGNSGLGEALKKVPYGSHSVVDSEDPKEWAKAIMAVHHKDREVRLIETVALCREYAEAYSWQEQCAGLVERMLDTTLEDEQDQSMTGRHLLNPVVSQASKEPAHSRSLQKATRIFHDLKEMHCDAEMVNKKTTLSKDLKKIASDVGFIVSDNPASGNCMFYALSEQLQSVKGINLSHMELRNTLVQFLRENSHLHDGTPLFNFVCGYPSWPEYLGSMEKDGTWGDNLVLSAAANCYRTDIRVVSSLGREVLIRPDRPVANTSPLVLGHIHEEHYVSLQPKHGTTTDEEDSLVKERHLSTTVISQGFKEPSRSLHKGTYNSVVVNLLKAEYNRRAQFRPLLWLNGLQLPLENVYTRLKIVSRRKAGVQGEGNEVNVDDILGALEKGEGFMTLVEGSLGIGKTTFCLKLAYDWANENATTRSIFHEFELVLLLKCRDIDTDIMDAIVNQLLPEDIEDKTREKLLDFIRDIHNQERILIILDGLDELPQKSKHHVDELLHRRILPFCYLLATTRQEKGTEVRKDFVFDILLQIEGFTENDSFEYIKKHFASISPADSSKGEMLIEEIKENTLLHALRNNPLNLLLLCLIYEDYEGNLPSSPRELYQTIVLCLLRSYCAKHNLEAHKDNKVLEEKFEKDILALGKLAWKCLLTDRYGFREEELTELESRKSKLIARELGLLYMKEGLKRIVPQHEYCFLHKTFQEYLAASYVARKLRKKQFKVFEHLTFDVLVKKYPQVFSFVSDILGEEANFLFSQIGKKLQSSDFIPAYVRARGEKALAAYHRALASGRTYDKRVKILLVGQDRVGKTSLSKSLRGEPFNDAEPSTDGVQMIPPVKNAGSDAWRNPTSLEHTSVFDHKISAKITEELFSTHAELPSERLRETGVTEDQERITEASSETFQKARVAREHASDKKTPGRQNAHSDNTQQEPLEGNPGRQHAHSENTLKETFEGNLKPNQKEPFRVTPKDEDIIPQETAFLIEEKLKKNEVEQDDKIWPVIWDFAGQDIYRAIHPIFMSSDDIYLLVFDLTKQLTSLAECRVNLNNKEYSVTARDSEDTNLDHLLRWMDLIHSLKKCYQNEGSPSAHPPVIIVGTHADRVDSRKAIGIVKQKCSRVLKEFSEHIVNCLPIDNTKAGKTADHEKIITLRNAILDLADKMPHTKKEIPLQWHRVEKEISKLTWQEKKYLQKKTFRKEIVSRYCSFDDEGDFDELLHFLHARGSIVYHEYTGDEDGLVVLDPQWLINVLCEIIKVTPDDDEVWSLSQDRTDLREKGILQRRLLNYACKNQNLDPIKDSLISLMEKFNLICKWPTSKAEDSIILVPCMLTTKSEEGNAMDQMTSNCLAPIYLTFKETNYVPGGLFCRLVVLFGKWLSDPEFTHKYSLHANEARFALDQDGHFIVLVCYKAVIKLHIQGPVDSIPSKRCRNVLCHLIKFMETLRQECHWLNSMTVRVCALCTICFGKHKPCERHDEEDCQHLDCAHYIPLESSVICCKPGHPLQLGSLQPWIEALGNLEVTEKSDDTQCSAGKLKRKSSSCSDTTTSPKRQKDEIAVTTQKEGKPSDYELEKLSEMLGNSWEKLARRLGFHEGEITGFHKDNEEYSKKLQEFPATYKKCILMYKWLTRKLHLTCQRI